MPLCHVFVNTMLEKSEVPHSYLQLMRAHFYTIFGLTKLTHVAESEIVRRSTYLSLCYELVGEAFKMDCRLVIHLLVKVTSSCSFKMAISLVNVVGL